MSKIIVLLLTIIIILVLIFYFKVLSVVFWDGNLGIMLDVARPLRPIAAKNIWFISDMARSLIKKRKVLLGQYRHSYLPVEGATETSPASASTTPASAPAQAKPTTTSPPPDKNIKKVIEESNKDSKKYRKEIIPQRTRQQIESTSTANMYGDAYSKLLWNASMRNYVDALQEKLMTYEPPVLREPEVNDVFLYKPDFNRLTGKLKTSPLVKIRETGVLIGPSLPGKAKIGPPETTI